MGEGFLGKAFGLVLENSGEGAPENFKQGSDTDSFGFRMRCSGNSIKGGRNKDEIGQGKGPCRDPRKRSWDAGMGPGRGGLRGRRGESPKSKLNFGHITFKDPWAAAVPYRSSPGNAQLGRAGGKDGVVGAGEGVRHYLNQAVVKARRMDDIVPQTVLPERARPLWLFL